MEPFEREFNSCLASFIDPLLLDVKYCEAIDDGYLCWPPTAAGVSVFQGCPKERLSDTNNNAFRICGDNGLWLGRKANESSYVGWTNYTPCFPSDVRNLLTKVYNDEQDAQEKFVVAERTRILEIVGFSMSLIALVISLLLFTRYRSLRNNRTRIHKSLFTAMIVQVIIRLTLYIDQALARSRIADGISSEAQWCIENMPYLCEASYVLLEYAGTVMFMWMFIEGLYLHNVVTGNSLRERQSHKLYYVLGWGLPLVITGLWATMSHLHYKKEPAISCWYGYNFTSLYWIVQGPRLAVIIINLVFLLNIMRVLIMKLRRSESNEIVKVRKAVRAALVLLPLLGITNILNMIEPPLNSVFWFAMWCYITHSLRSFQGFFIAFIYCFMNGEVRAVVRKQYEDYMAVRVTARHRGSDQTQRRQRRLCTPMCCCRDLESPDVFELAERRPVTPHPSHVLSETELDTYITQLTPPVPPRRAMRTHGIRNPGPRLANPLIAETMMLGLRHVDLRPCLPMEDETTLTVQPHVHFSDVDTVHTSQNYHHICRIQPDCYELCF